MFSVLTLNLRFGLAEDGPNSWRYREKGYPVLFEKYRSDFFGFQEANDFQIDFIDNILTGYNYIGKRTPSPIFWQNNIVFYKSVWTCVYYEHFFLSPTPTVPSRFRKSLWPRQCTVGMFQNSDRKLICINTHLDFEESIQIESAKLILERLSHLPTDIPVILIGDFNSPPFSPCHNIFTGHHQTSAEKGAYFKNAFKRPFPATHHGFTGNSDGDHIDWILYRGEIAVKSSKVVRETFDGMYVSDHFPLYAVFKEYPAQKK